MDLVSILSGFLCYKTCDCISLTHTNASCVHILQLLLFGYCEQDYIRKLGTWMCDKAHYLYIFVLDGTLCVDCG